MKMSKIAFKALAGAAIALTTSLSAAQAQSLTDCNLPNSADKGPIKGTMYVVGTFPEGPWLHQKHRKMDYKGNGIYQAVINEKPGNVKFQFATINWNPQYTAKGLKMAVGEEKAMMRGGFVKDTSVSFASNGKYVWTIQVDSKRKPLRGVIARCN